MMSTSVTHGAFTATRHNASGSILSCHAWAPTNHVHAQLGHVLSRRQLPTPGPIHKVQGHRTSDPRWSLRSSTEGEVVTSESGTSSEATASAQSENGAASNGAAPAVDASPVPAVELAYVEPSQARKFLSWWKLQWALPWRRFPAKSVLVLELGGDISEKPTGRFGDAKTIPQITRALQKAALDYRVEGVYLKISTLGVGWAKLQELTKYLEYFNASGKWSCAYLDRAGEKEYFLASACQEVFVPPSGNLSLRGLAVSGSFLRGVLDKVGVEPQVKRIGIYKSAGDQILRRDMSDAQREQLTALLDDIYAGFVAQVAEKRKKTPQEVEAMLDAGIYKMEEYAQGGWITALKYEDEVLDMLKERTGGKDDEVQAVELKKYSYVSPSAFGLYGRKKIAVLRASGAIVGGDGVGNNITAQSVINQLRALGKNKRIAAVVLRVDSPGGDALASDLMWREIRKLREKKPVIASMSDVAASGGYYMAMACEKIVAESLTITGSIGVVTGKFNLQELYERLGFSKTFISKGQYAELLADNRSFTENELKLFDESAEYAYESFRNKAAESRGLSVEAMQAVAQGRVWSGKRALEAGLVDAVGGLTRAVQLAREAAKIEADEDISVVEVTRQGPPSPLSLLSQLASVRVPALLQVAILALGGQSGSSALLQLMEGGVADSMQLQLLTTPGRPLALMPDIKVLGASELQ